MNTIRLIVLLILIPLFGFSQLEITGVVMDNEEPITFANVVLRDSTDTIKTGGITDDVGKFKISSKKGKRNLTISFIGYKDWSKEIILENDIDLGNIILEPDSESLDEVVIKAEKRMIELKTDRIVFNLGNNVIASGGDALNALSVAPGLIIQNNAITMLGKGASRVMVDDRLIALEGDDLMSFLNSISGADIKSIEIINNPPAKYGAAGNGGLINIIMKKGRLNSWKNTISATLDQSTFGFYTLRNNFFYNKNKVKFSLNVSGRKGDIRRIEELDVFFPEGTRRLIDKAKQKKDNLSGRMTLDYDITDNTSIGVQYLGNLINPDRIDPVVTNVFNPDNTLNSVLINNGFNDMGTENHTYNAHLISKLDTIGRKISFDFDYFKFDSQRDNVFRAESFTPNGEFLGVDLSARNTSDQNVSNFSAKVDVEHPFKFVNLSYGGKVSFIDTDADAKYFDTITGTEVLDPNQSNEFEYSEQISAVYLNGTKNIGDKLSLQLGLRVENTQTEGVSRTLNQVFENDYLKLFPTVYLSYKKNDNNDFSINYGRRINRPNFENLNPFRSYINSNSFSEGNPFLQPSFSDNIDFNYTYKGKLRTNLFLNITSDGHGVVFTSDPTTNTQIITRQNYYKEYYYGLGQSYSASFTSWWRSNNYFYLLGAETEFIDGINAVPQNNIQAYFSTNNVISLSETTKLELNFLYVSSNQRGLYEQDGLTRLNIGLKKSFLDDNLQVSLLVNDVFQDGFLQNYTSTINGVKQIYTSNDSSRFFRASISYSFGNNKINVNKRGFGNDEERNRSNN